MSTAASMTTETKPVYGRRDLVKAGALVLAEIERIDRAALAAQREGGAA